MPKENTPLLKKISEYLKQTSAGFHTPGHRQGKGCLLAFRQLMGDCALTLDLTEVPGLDNLKNPDGCIRDSQALAAKLFGAVATFYLVNGSTVGLQAALLAMNSPGGKVLIPRHVHISVLNGLILSGGEPVFVPVELEKTWGIPFGASPQQFGHVLREKEARGEAVELAVTVQPTYQGIGYNASQIRRLFAEKRIAQIVDEAHGAHLFFQERYPFSLQKEQADVVIQSTHKTLTSLTQASMLHVNKAQFIEPVQTALNILQTTSPSYILMASLDSVQAQMAEKGLQLAEQVLELADFFRAKLAALPGYAVFSAAQLPAGWYQDPAKVLVSAAELGWTGWELADELQKQYGIVVEMADYYYVLFLLTPGHCQEDVEKVIRALQEISKRDRGRDCRNCTKSRHLLSVGADSSTMFSAELYEKPVELVMPPRKVYYNKKEEVSLAQAVGRISGAPLTVYPPGIPFLWPGQLIAKEHVEYLQWARQNRINMQGIRADEKILVCR